MYSTLAAIEEDQASSPLEKQKFCIKAFPNIAEHEKNKEKIHIWIFSLPLKLLILFENLLYNAISFTPEGGCISVMPHISKDYIGGKDIKNLHKKRPKQGPSLFWPFLIPSFYSPILLALCIPPHTPA